MYKQLFINKPVAMFFVIYSPAETNRSDTAFLSKAAGINL